MSRHGCWPTGRVCCNRTGVLDVLDQGVGTVVDSALELVDDMVDLFEEDSEEVRKRLFAPLVLVYIYDPFAKTRSGRTYRKS